MLNAKKARDEVSITSIPRHNRFKAKLLKHSKMEKDVIDQLVPRLQKIGINIELSGNYPWIYLNKINGNRIKEEDYFKGNHGFTIAFYPIRKGQKMKLTDISKIFEIIRKYK